MCGLRVWPKSSWTSATLLWTIAWLTVVQVATARRARLAHSSFVSKGPEESNGCGVSSSILIVPSFVFFLHLFLASWMCLGSRSAWCQFPDWCLPFPSCRGWVGWSVGGWVGWLGVVCFGLFGVGCLLAVCRFARRNRLIIQLLGIPY